MPLHNIYREQNAFESLQDWECERLNIPPVPAGVRRAVHYLTEERLRRRNYGKMTKDAQEYHITKGMEEAEAMRQWRPLVITAMELPATELFLRLRRCEIEAMGKLLPSGVEIIDFLEDQNSYSRSDFSDLADTVIPHEFWTMSGIDWLSNAVTAHGNCYCDVSILVKDTGGDNVRQPARTRGRPPTFAWEAFHVEVAALIKNGQMPQKKEAAIQQMLSWFASTQGGQAPSRSAVSEKLTPYYRKFFSGN